MRKTAGGAEGAEEQGETSRMGVGALRTASNSRSSRREATWRLRRDADGVPDGGGVMVCSSRLQSAALDQTSHQCAQPGDAIAGATPIDAGAYVLCATCGRLQLHPGFIHHVLLLVRHEFFQLHPNDRGHNEVAADRHVMSMNAYDA